MWRSGVAYTDITTPHVHSKNRNHCLCCAVAKSMLNCYSSPHSCFESSALLVGNTSPSGIICITSLSRDTTLEQSGWSYKLWLSCHASASGMDADEGHAMRVAHPSRHRNVNKKREKKTTRIPGKKGFACSSNSYFTKLSDTPGLGFALHVSDTCGREVESNADCQKASRDCSVALDL